MDAVSARVRVIIWVRLKMKVLQVNVEIGSVFEFENHLGICVV